MLKVQTAHAECAPAAGCLSSNLASPPLCRSRPAHPAPRRPAQPQRPRSYPGRRASAAAASHGPAALSATCLRPHPRSLTCSELTTRDRFAACAPLQASHSETYGTQQVLRGYARCAALRSAPIAPETAPAAKSTSGRGSTAKAASGRETISLPPDSCLFCTSRLASSKEATGGVRRGRRVCCRGAAMAALQLTVAWLPLSLRETGKNSSASQLQLVAAGAQKRRHLNSTLIVRVMLHCSVLW